MESILTSIKKLLEIQADYTHFDMDLTICINSVLAILTQLGVGPATGFSILDESATWEDYIGSDPRLEMIKSFMHLRVRLLFDPPQNAFAMGNCITLEDTNGNRKLYKKRYEQKIDAVAALMDAYIAYKANREAFGRA